MSRNNNSFNDKLSINMVNICMHEIVIEYKSFPCKTFLVKVDKK